MPSNTTTGGTEPHEEHTAAEYALLGLLREGACHGYRLAAAFAPEGRLGLIVRLKMSQMYAYLHKLERKGWLAAYDETPGALRPRRVFALTPAGEAAYDAWLAAPVGATRAVRLDFMVKLAFTMAQDRAAARALIERQRASTSAWLDQLRARQVSPPAQPARRPLLQRPPAGEANEPVDRPAAEQVADLGPLVLRHRIRQSEATLAWLDEVRAAL